MNVAGPISRRNPLSSSSRHGKQHGPASPIPGEQGGPHVDMYLETPSFELSLDEFEEYALARLKVRCM